MSKKHYVFSTLAAAVSYTGYAAPLGDSLPQVAMSVVVNGGAGVANKRTLDTPRGVVTEVTEEEAKFLAGHPVFQIHLKNGYVQISDAKADGDEAAADLTGRDESAPLVDEDFSDNDAQPQGNKAGKAAKPK